MDLDRLKKLMQKFLDDEDRDFIVNDDTAEHMAKAALLILTAMRDNEKYGFKEGYFNN
jgi:hypothetical protein